MVVHTAKNMRTAREQAAKARKRGLNASVFKKKGGRTRVSVTRS